MADGVSFLDVLAKGQMQACNCFVHGSVSFGLHQHRRSQVVLWVPPARHPKELLIFDHCNQPAWPIGWARGHAASAKDALVHSIQLGTILLSGAGNWTNGQIPVRGSPRGFGSIPALFRAGPMEQLT